MNQLITLPDFDLSPIDRATLADGTKRHYKTAILLMFAANVDPYNHTQLANYAASLPSSGRSFLKAAIGLLARDLINKAKMSNAPVETIQRFLWLMEAIQDTIEVKQPDSKRTPHWLSQEQVNTILDSCTDPRDRVVMSVLLGAGLRREELETLEFEAIGQIPHNGRMQDVITVHGKGDKTRIVPISKTLAETLKSWQRTTKGGRVARKYNKGGKLGKSLSAYGIFTIVRKYGLLLGIDNLDPHDLRRTYGRILYDNTQDIIRVKNILGHADTKTTLKYIGYDLELESDGAPI
jgi:site-specific recombinase XerC